MSLHYYPDTKEEKYICLYCDHSWVEVLEYGGHGEYFCYWNPYLRCPECKAENIE